MVEKKYKSPCETGDGYRWSFGRTSIFESDTGRNFTWYTKVGERNFLTTSARLQRECFYNLQIQNNARG